MVYSFRTLKFEAKDISPLVENGYNFYKNIKIDKCFYKMSNFYPSSISYLTYCVTTNVISFDNAICLDFSQDLQILFPLGQFKKKPWKKLFLKNNEFLLKF